MLTTYTTAPRTPKHHVHHSTPPVWKPTYSERNWSSSHTSAFSAQKCRKVSQLNVKVSTDPSQRRAQSLSLSLFTSQPLYSHPGSSLLVCPSISLYLSAYFCLSLSAYFCLLSAHFCLSTYVCLPVSQCPVGSCVCVAATWLTSTRLSLRIYFRMSH